MANFSLAAILNISAILNFLNTQQAIFDFSWSRLQKNFIKSVLAIIAHGTIFSYKLNPNTIFSLNLIFSKNFCILFFIIFLPDLAAENFVARDEMSIKFAFRNSYKIRVEITSKKNIYLYLFIYNSYEYIFHPIWITWVSRFG
jgi:hypothetical protein